VSAERRLTVSAWTFIVSALFAGSVPFTDFLPNHAFDETWPGHARFHIMMAASHLFALALLTILIAWFPFRAGRPWSWFALGLYWIFGLGLIPLIAYWQGSGPPMRPLVLVSLALLATLAALVFSWRPIFRPRAPL